MENKGEFEGSLAAKRANAPRQYLFQAEHEQIAFANSAVRRRMASANTEFTVFGIGLTPSSNEGLMK